MSTPRLKAEIWVKAYIRQCAAQDVPAVVVRRGDETAGTVLVRINRLDGTSRVLMPATNLEGERIWLYGTGPEPVPDAQADAYIDSQLKFDHDLWVVEVEDRHGRHFLENVEA